MNRFQLLGRLGAIKSSDNVTRLRVAIDSSYTDRTTGKWVERTDWTTVVVFPSGIRGYIADHIAIGDLVLCEGRIQERRYEQDGDTRYATDLVCARFKRLAKRQGGAADHTDGADEYARVPF